MASREDENHRNLVVMRAALRRAAAEMERSGEAPTKPWRAGACWSIVDRHEDRGRRYIVAVEVAPSSTGPDALTSRERQVVAAAAAGRSNKVIAYDFGLSDSTVRVLLARSAKKLGVKRRTEVVARYLALARPATSE